MVVLNRGLAGVEVARAARRILGVGKIPLNKTAELARWFCLRGNFT